MDMPTNGGVSQRAKLIAASTRVLAIIGFVGVLSVGMWGSVQVAKAVPGALSSVAAAIVSLTSIFIPASGPGAEKTNTPVVEQATTTIAAAATSTPPAQLPEEKPVTVPTATPPAPKPSTSASTPAQPAPAAYVDLAVRVIEIGVVDRETGTFTASSTPMRGNRIAVRFAVENKGTKVSPQWSFNAVLPTLPSYVYVAPMQQELGPGDRIEYTIGFDTFQTNSDSGDIVINVDPTGRVNEPNKENNIIRYTVTVTK